jgi:hypothetical protein
MAKRVTSTLCRWCGKPLTPVTTEDGRQIARQCPLCLDWAPGNLDVGKEPPRKKAPTSSERKANQKTKAAKAARQLGLFGK